jgi:type 1 glutamine amidotransferase/HEAT repeat protein
MFVRNVQGLRMRPIEENGRELMKRFSRLSFGIVTLLFLSAVCLLPDGWAQQLVNPTAEEIARMQAAAPEKTRVQPEKKRKLLVFNLSYGFVHTSILFGSQAIEIMGNKTGAYETVVSTDISMFEPEKLAQFDAVVFNNTNNELFLPDPEVFKKMSPAEQEQALKRDAALKESFVNYLKNGGGLMIIHAGIASFREWPEWGNIGGARFTNHPWMSGSKVTMKVEEPENPLSKAFPQTPFEVTDETYQMAEPYSRERLRVLVSLDTEKTDMKSPLVQRTDGDFAISWARSYGKGRVFYCAIGHDHPLFWNTPILQHYLDGIQFALGDLKGDTTPSAFVKRIETAPWQSLFDGKNLDGWVQRGGKAKYTIDGEEIVGTTVKGTPNSFLCTETNYSDFILELEYKVHPKLNSGIQIRSESYADYQNGRVHGYQVEIDPEPRAWSGGIYDEGRRGWLNDLKNNEPARQAFKQNEWNHYRIQAMGPSIKTWINGVPAADLQDDMTASGFIALQVHATNLDEPMEIRWRKIRIQDLSANTRTEPLPSDLVSKTLDYDWNKSRKPLIAVEDAVKNASPAQRRQLEAMLLDALKSPQATPACKDFCCRQLARVGTTKSVAPLAAFLNDEKLGDMARFALQEIPAPAVDAALREALKSLKGRNLTGAINTLGIRGDGESVDVLAEQTKSSDAEVARAALNALGRIGSPESAKALSEIPADGPSGPARSEALLTCADLIAQRRAPKDAVKIYQDLTDTKQPLPVRVGAYMGLARSDKTKAVETVLTLIKSAERPLVLAGCQLVRELEKGNPEATRAWSGALASAQPKTQAPLITSLGERGDKTAREAVTEMLKSPDESVRLGAIRALGSLGTADSIPVLTDVVSKAETLSGAVTDALTRVNDPVADGKLIEYLTENAAAPVQVCLISAMAARRTKGAVPALLKASESGDEKVWQAAFEALGLVAGAEDFGKMVASLVQTKDAARRSAAVRAIAAMSRDLKDTEACAKQVVEALPQADKAGQSALLELLPKFGGQTALEAVRKPVAGNDAELKEAAVRALSNWPTADPMADLLKVAETDQGTQRVLALRGLARMAPLPGQPTKPQRVEMIEKALKLAADRPEETKLLQQALKTDEPKEE